MNNNPKRFEDRAADIARDIETLASAASEAADEAKKAKLFDACLLYMHLRAAHEELKDATTKVYNIMNFVGKGILPDKFMEQGGGQRTASFPEIGKQFVLSERVSISTLDFEQAKSWLEEHNALDLVTERIDPQTLGAWFRNEYFKETNKDLPMDIFKTNRDQVVSVRTIAKSE